MCSSKVLFTIALITFSLALFLLVNVHFCEVLEIDLPLLLLSLLSDYQYISFSSLQHERSRPSVVNEDVCRALGK